MSEPQDLPDLLKDLIDDYLSGLLEEARTKELEELLCADAEARRYFVRYARLHTDLHLEMRARRAGERALGRIEQLMPGGAAPGQAGGGAPPRSRWFAWCVRPAALTAAALLLAVTAGWWFVRGRPGPADAPGPGPAVAWLVNAQNCRWAQGEPAGDMRAGRILMLERGLAEIRFGCGARVVLEGPAGLELLSARSARLLRGKLTARVPDATTGFEVLSPQGKVIDLGTEFGVLVSDQGATDVYVF